MNSLFDPDRITINGTSVPLLFRNGTGRTVMALRANDLFTGIKIMNSGMHNVGVAGNITATTDSSIHIELNNFPLHTIKLHEGVNSIDFSDAQSFNENDVITVRVGSTTKEATLIFDGLTFSVNSVGVRRSFWSSFTCTA